MKYLIVKLGAMGDVLRTTPLLRRLKEQDPQAQITWLTSKSSAEVLASNSLIHHLLVVERDPMPTETFDWAFNADEDRAACTALLQANAKIKKGYTWAENTYAPVDTDAQYAFRLTKEDPLKFHENQKTYQQILFETAGVGAFAGEEMVLESTGYGVRGTEPKEKKPRIALNHLVGHKWPTKAWESWDQLKQRLEPRWTVSVQKEFPTFREYAEWIHAHDVVVTSDSLGLHVAAALRKRVVAIVGPTCPQEIELYGRGVKLFVKNLFCAPCYKAVCPYHHECMTGLSVEMLINAIEGEVRKT